MAYAEDVWLRLRDARDELEGNQNEDGLRKFVGVVARLPKRINPDTNLLSDAAAEELLDVSDKFESYKLGMSYEGYIKEVSIEKRYEYFNGHFIATNIQLSGLTWDAIMRIWELFRSKYVYINQAFKDGAVSRYIIKSVLEDVNWVMHLIEEYHGR